MARYAYLTCELKSRDLDSRLLVAAHLVARGLSVVVGQQWSMFANAHHAPAGVFLFKTANNIQVQSARTVKASGHRTVFMDEEILAIVDPYCIRTITAPDVFDVADAFLFQSDEHRKVLNGNGPVVGSLRVDLLREHREIYQAEADAFQRQGRYLLINTNYGLVNNAFANVPSILETTRQAGSIEEETAAGKAYVRSWQDVEALNMAEMQSLLGRLQGQLSDTRIVLRTHPTENPEPWKNFTGVDVVSGSSPTGWLLGADFIVHTNSTTGMEAALLDKPVLNLNPAPNTPFSRQYLMNEATPRAASGEEAASFILNALAGPPPTVRADWLPPFPPQCAKLVADEIEKRTVDSAEITQWNRLVRAVHHVKKFEVQPAEFLDRLRLFLFRVGYGGVQITILDDSLFLLTP